MTLKPMFRPRPSVAHACGEVVSRKVPTLKASPDPVLEEGEEEGNIGDQRRFPPCEVNAGCLSTHKRR